MYEPGWSPAWQFSEFLGALGVVASLLEEVQKPEPSPERVCELAAGDDGAGFHGILSLWGRLTAGSLANRYLDQCPRTLAKVESLDTCAESWHHLVIAVVAKMAKRIVGTVHTSGWPFPPPSVIAQAILANPRGNYAAIIESMRGLSLSTFHRHEIGAGLKGEFHNIEQGLKKAVEQVDTPKSHRSEEYVALEDVVFLVGKPAKKTIRERIRQSKGTERAAPEPIKTGGSSKDTFPYAALRQWLIVEFAGYRLDSLLPKNFTDFLGILHAAKVSRGASTVP